MRSWVRGHLEVEVRGLGESQPDLEGMLVVYLKRDGEGCTLSYSQGDHMMTHVERGKVEWSLTQ